MIPYYFLFCHSALDAESSYFLVWIPAGVYPEHVRFTQCKLRRRTGMTMDNVRIYLIQIPRDLVAGRFICQSPITSQQPISKSQLPNLRLDISDQRLETINQR